MIKLTCHCGQASLEIASRPEFINECNCSLCSKAGAQWAYCAPEDVSISGRTSTYRRTDKDEPAAQVHFCPDCGTTTHFSLTESTIAQHGNTMLGANMRLAEAGDLAGIELKFPDGKSWDGKGEFEYVREAVILS